MYIKTTMSCHPPGRNVGESMKKTDLLYIVNENVN